MKRIFSGISIAALWFLIIFLFIVYKTYQKTHEFPFDFTFQHLIAFAVTCSMLYFLTISILSIKNPTIKKILLPFLAGSYAIFGFYHYKTTQYFDFSIIADHWKSIWRPGSFVESLKVVHSVFGPADYFRSLLAMIIMFFLVKREEHKFVNKRWPVAIATASFIALFFITPNPVDELTSFSKSALNRLFSIKTSFHVKYKPKDTQYLPLIKTYTAKHGTAVKPNMFFIFVESLNARFLEAKAPNGKEFTPFMNSLITQGMYFERFYSQSIQTGRSHFASLCGLTPSIVGKEFERFVNRKLNCLPQILTNNGYQTIFSKANEDINFDNTFNFVTRHGFKIMNTMGKGCSKDDKGLCWGWGIPDNIFYKRFFAYLQGNQMFQEPIFASLATISSHMPFNEVPLQQRMIYKDPKSRLENYSNAIRITDDYLKTFFAELKNSPFGDNAVVFLMGDHSFPMGEHNNFQNETFAFEENFRTPLLVLDFRKVKVIPVKRVKEAYSQINLPTTVLDLAGISTRIHFQGNSLLDTPPSYVHLVQPYGGIYFSVIKYPYKYILYDRSEKEFIFNLAKDPSETNNLAKEWNDPKLLEEFRQQVGQIWFNYEILENDRVWVN